MDVEAGPAAPCPTILMGLAEPAAAARCAEAWQVTQSSLTKTDL